LFASLGLLVLLANLLRIRLGSKLILKLLLLLLSRLPIFLADLLGIGLGRSFGLESHFFITSATYCAQENMIHSPNSILICVREGF
jgi:hypothetical protein